MTLKLFGFSVQPAERIIREVKVAEFPDGTPISIVVRSVTGMENGPLILMLGVQHGDEYSGMEIINRLIDQIEPKALSGVVVGIPVANPLAFNTHGRSTPQSMGYENLNLNRVWPGNPKGLLTEKIAAHIWKNLVVKANYVLDFHEGGQAFIARYMTARITEKTDRDTAFQIKKLSKLFGQGVPVLAGLRKGTRMGALSVQSGLNDIPCITPELGGGGRIWEEHVKTGVQGAKNIMIGLEMLQEEPVGTNEKQIVAEESTWPRTERGGILYNTCELGASVKKGAKLGILKNILNPRKTRSDIVGMVTPDTRI